MSTFQIHHLTNVSQRTTFWIRTNKCIIIGVVQGLAHLHKCYPIVVHLDIKPRNILLDQEYTPKLVDFGLAKFLDGKNEDVVCAHHSFFYQLCACTIYLSVIVNLANLNIFFGHNLLISCLHYYRSWNKYDKRS